MTTIARDSQPPEDLDLHKVSTQRMKQSMNAFFNLKIRHKFANSKKSLIDCLFNSISSTDHLRLGRASAYGARGDVSHPATRPSQLSTARNLEANSVASLAEKEQL